ncbi:MAG: alpha/beta fold hydrolase [Porticoccaceae bacterium]
MKLNYTDQGSGNPIFLIHGLFGSLSNLGNLARALVPSFRVVCVDLRNHGDSPHDGQMSLLSMAADIVELMDDLSIAHAFFVGHSLGGKVAMQLAMTNPDRVRSLVVADIAPVKYRDNNSILINALQELSKIAINNRKSADLFLSELGIELSVRAFLLKNLRRNAQGNFDIKINIEAIKANYEDHLSTAPQGQNFTGPCLFLKGENSDYIQQQYLPVINSLFPQSSVKTIESAGHWLHAEKPELFNQLVLQFISENS